MKKTIYFDNAATTKPDNEVTDAMLPCYREYYGNASSIHQLGKASKVLLEDTRDLIADFIGAKSKEIFFAGSGTEANNIAVKGIAFNFLDKGKDHIITSELEHSSILDTVNYLKEKFNFKVTCVNPGSDGLINPGDVLNAINERTFLISLMHSNNETGNLTDISTFAGEAIQKNTYIHSDTVQSIGKIKINVKDLNVNFATVSAHKIYGPKGIAALYIKDKTPVDKFIHGGMQERNMRGGTENIPAVAGFKKAIEILKGRMDKDIESYLKLKNYLREKLTGIYNDSIIFNTCKEHSLPNILNFSFNPENFTFDEEMLIIMLDLKGIAVSGGSACTSGTNQPSHVLTALGRDKRTSMASLRVSFGRENTAGEVDYFVKALKEIVIRN